MTKHSKEKRHCERCVLTLLEPLLGADAGDFAMEFTCFPMCCTTARGQAMPHLHSLSRFGCSGVGGTPTSVRTFAVIRLADDAHVWSEDERRYVTVCSADDPILEH